MPNAATTERNAYKWTSRGGIESELNLVAEEVPLALIYNGEPFSVMMVSPADLENFVVGFSLTENIVSVWQDIGGVEFVHSDKGIAAYISVDKKSSDALSKRKKNLVGRTGCGICGEETLEATLAKTKQVTNTTRFDNFAIQRAITSLSDTQVMNHGVGTFHGAAWADCAGDIVCVREDVGRHNAVDKIAGYMFLNKINGNNKIFYTTGRLTSEMVIKTVKMMVPILISRSGFTSWGVELAKKTNLTLIGRAKGKKYLALSGEKRIDYK